MDKTSTLKARRESPESGSSGYEQQGGKRRATRRSLGLRHGGYVLAVGGSAVIAYALKAIIGLRASSTVEEQGLDDAEHGEQAYHHDEIGRVSHDTSTGDMVMQSVVA
jgi:Ammonium Transporter Family